MILTDDHRLLTSFKEYLEWWLIDQKQLYKNVSTNVYDFSDPYFSSFRVWASPYAQFVHQLDVTGLATTQVTNSGSPISDVKIDFKNGKLLTSNNSYTTSNIKFEGGVKEINVYLTSSSDSFLALEETYHLNSLLRGANSGINPYDKYYPALFIKINNTYNEPFAFGGVDITKWKIRVISIMPDEKYVVGIIGLLRDLKRRIFPVLHQNSSPLNEYGDLKDYGWAYKSFLGSNSDLVSIEDVIYTPIEPDKFQKDSSNTYIGLHDFIISWVDRN